MGQILKFPADAGARRPRHEGTDIQAEILFFTGVRYERHPETAETGPAPRDRKPQRSGQGRKKRQA